MKVVNGFEDSPAFDVLTPTRRHLPFVFNSPHSGRSYPSSFISSSRLDAASIRRSEDAYVDELFEWVVSLGAPMIRAHFPRAYLDVNREPYELDPKMFEERLPPYANVRSIRVAGGLGTIARIVGESQEIYRKRLPVNEAISRIESIYKPYHRTLRRLLAETHVSFGYAVLVDCHSMPSTIRNPDGGPRPDFILGDRYGTSCSPVLVEAAMESLRAMGYTVSRNKPYAGGFITEHYGRPAKALHALQLEINRALYMDEASLKPHDGFTALSRDLHSFVRDLTEIGGNIFEAGAIAAE
ncbi:N-formylglutamate amidohydrolase [Rhizobiales bacterium]|uniref:N-formylglutamate amidohydrolase n=1 Tax=Hongsoonwoonella zoysiae TaxID=2821844 RepID=UPI0015606AD5|nr:N-formylglutamate amidohydrolase [Hongsoonwoonella zoysiae]NRG17324.1 N-formylglutamate amidohydrolase [Hongsoonwoonella zoysiae]